MKWKYYHTVWFIMLFGWITNYMVRSGLSPTLISIIDEFSLNYSQAGLIASAVFYSYTMMQLPAGFIGDKIGRKSVLVVCCFGWGITSLLTGVANSYASLLGYRFLTGIAQGTFFSNDRSIIAFYTPREKAGFGQGISFIGLGLGMFIGILLAGVICERLGWRWVFYLYSIPSFVAALLITKRIKEPEVSDQVSQSNNMLSKTQKGSFGTIFKSYDLWMLYIGSAAGVYAIWMLGAWAPAMFKEIGITELSRSSFFASLLGLSAIPGLVISGWFTDKLFQKGVGRKVILSLELFLAATILFFIGLAISIKADYHALILLIFFAGFFLWGTVAPLYSAISDIVPPSAHGSTYGLTNTIGYIGGLVTPWITGILKDTTGSFSFACYIAAIFCMTAAITILSIRPSFRFSKEKALI